MCTNIQARREIRVFKKFAPHFPLPIDPNSIQKRKPPEPDILCCLEDGTKIAFELVEIIDEDLANRTFSALNLKRGFEEDFDNLPRHRKDQLNQKYGNALIYIAFKDKISSIRRRSSIPMILEFLLILDDKTEGKYTPSSHSALGETVRWVNISRGDFVGPCFDFEAVGSFAEPVCNRIEDKFKKQYRVKAIVELVAYYELQPELPKNHWLPSLKHFLERSLKNSIFNRIWVYSISQNKILYVYPQHINAEKRKR
ncbi:MAG: hypothetical protein JRJ38_18880 [Deltaproteobacteria bacterium]|nr:hypothetical protein [Deltaproteobacteria bacterium]